MDKAVSELYQDAGDQGIQQWSSECGPQACSVSITWGLAGNANTRAHSGLTALEALDVDPRNLCSDKLSRRF